jgi:hypothetical protein
MLFLDVKKAFDSVWHDALLRIIYSCQNDRTFQVSVGKSKSSVCNIPFGVPQSAVLSLTLYNFLLGMPLWSMGVSLLHLPMTLPYLCPVRTQRLSAMEFRGGSTY